MPRLLRALAILGTLAACSRPAPDPPAITRAPDPPPVAAAPTASETVAAAAKEPPKATEPCDPQGPDNPVSPEERGSMTGIKFEAAWQVECKERLVSALLDAARARLAGEAPAFAARLAAERREFSAFNEELSGLVEGHHWIDYAAAQRSDGTMRDTPRLATKVLALDERLVAARLLAQGDAAGLAARVRERAAAGDKARARLAAIARKGRELLPKLPAQAKGDEFPLPLLKGDMNAVLSGIGAVERRAQGLARALCAWEPLSRELGAAACEKQVGSYYLASWNEDPEP